MAKTLMFIVLFAAMSVFPTSLVLSQDPTKPSVQRVSLQFTKGQSESGKEVYLAKCSFCHNPKLTGGFGPALKGASFTDVWFTGVVGTLFVFVRDNMPMDNPGSLTDEEISNLIAYLTNVNGKIPTGVELPQQLVELDNMLFGQDVVD